MMVMERSPELELEPTAAPVGVRPQTTNDFLAEMGINLIDSSKKLVSEPPITAPFTETAKQTNKTTNDFLAEMGIKLIDSGGLSTKTSSSKEKAVSTNDFLESTLGIKLIDSSADRKKALDAIKMPAHLTEASKAKRSRSPEKKTRHKRGIKFYAVLGLVAIGSWYASAVAGTAVMHRDDETTQTTPNTDYIVPPTTEETSTSTSTTTEVPTTEAQVPADTYDAKPGDLIGEFDVPATCTKMLVFAFDSREITNNVIGTGAGTIDKLIKDQNPQGPCPTVEQRLGAAAVTRYDRGANIYVPVGGHEIQPDGALRSVNPGQAGNSNIVTHRITESAPANDMLALRPGDTATYTPIKGNKAYQFEFIDNQLIKATNDDTLIVHYDNPHNYPATISWSACSDPNGNGGQKTYRIDGHFGLTGVTDKTA